MKVSEEKKDKIISIDEGIMKDHLGSMVRETVEETLNKMLDAEADQLLDAKKYERTERRKGVRSGKYNRTLMTKAGKVNLQVPKLKNISFETAIIERYQKRESSVEEALIEMYLAGVSVRRVEDVTQALWGTKVSPGTISTLNKKVYSKIDEWRNKPIEGEHPFVYLDAIYLKRSWGGEYKNVSIQIAFGVNQDGYREILGVCEGEREDLEGWSHFLKHLKSRGLKGVKLFISDKCLGLVESLPSYYPKAAWQRCMVHFFRNVLRTVPDSKTKKVSAMLKAIHAQEDREEATLKTKQVLEKLKLMKLTSAHDCLENGMIETLSYMSFPREYWRRIRTNNPLERVNREVKRRTRVVGAFPDGNSALMLVAARLRYIATKQWGLKKYLNTDLLRIGVKTAA